MCSYIDTLSTWSIYLYDPPQRPHCCSHSTPNSSPTPIPAASPLNTLAAAASLASGASIALPLVWCLWGPRNSSMTALSVPFGLLVLFPAMASVQFHPAFKELFSSSSLSSALSAQSLSLQFASESVPDLSMFGRPWLARALPRPPGCSCGCGLRAGTLSVASSCSDFVRSEGVNFLISSPVFECDSRVSPPAESGASFAAFARSSLVSSSSVICQ